MIRLATPDDAAAIEAFLKPHAATSIFLRMILGRFGTEERSHPAGTRFYLWCPALGIDGVFGLTNEGIVLAQHPANTPEAFAAFAQALRGQEVRGMTGAAPTMGHVLTAIGLGQAAWRINLTEPLFALNLTEPPKVQAQLRAPGAADEPLLTDWYAAYRQEVGYAPGPDPDEATHKARAAIAGQATQLMLSDEQPVAMATVHARAGDMIQIGDVFVPPAHRGQGLAGRVVLARLAQLYGTGIRTALLAVNNDAAARAYTRIGFEEVGLNQTGLLSTPAIIGQAP